MITPSAAPVDNGAITTTAIDTLGAAYLTVYVAVLSIDALMTALKLRESEASDLTGAVDVPGSIFGAAGAPALPGAADDGKVYAFHMDLRGRQRYLDLVAGAGDGAAGTSVFAWAELSRLSEMPSTATQRGLAGELFVPKL
ncbi:MAG TPA: hypothetical protein VGX48_18640 [Pyrinomonadaceae bacterium]|jgi:hypothetical protein|nr:hypothetical protein [Pyrinomonadaceae bacterium]